MKIPTKDELNHWWAVASKFYPWQQEFWLGLFHDTVEDGYIGEWLLSYWPALTYITRLKETGGNQYLNSYQFYIERIVTLHPATINVKIEDLKHNLSRPGKPSLKVRYNKALKYLENYRILNDLDHKR